MTKIGFNLRRLLHLITGGIGLLCMLLVYASTAATDGILVKMMRNLGLASTEPKVSETFCYAEHTFHGYFMPFFWIGTSLVAISFCLSCCDGKKGS